MDADAQFAADLAAATKLSLQSHEEEKQRWGGGGGGGARRTSPKPPSTTARTGRRGEAKIFLSKAFYVMP